MISSYQLVTNLLKEAETYTAGSVNMSEILEAKDLCDSYMELINVTQESSNEHTTLSIMLKWVSNENATLYNIKLGE